MPSHQKRKALGSTVKKITIIKQMMAAKELTNAIFKSIVDKICFNHQQRKALQIANAISKSIAYKNTITSSRELNANFLKSINYVRDIANNKHVFVSKSLKCEHQIIT